MSRLTQISPDESKDSDRWLMIQDASPNETIDVKNLHRLIRNVAGITGNKKLRYWVNKESLNLAEVDLLRLLQKVILRVTDEEFKLLLAFLQNEQEAKRLAASRPQILSKKKILCVDYDSETPDTLFKIVPHFRWLRTKFAPIPDQNHIPAVADLNAAWDLIGHLKLKNGLSLNKFIALLCIVSERNDNLDLFLTDANLTTAICKTPTGKFYTISDYLEFALLPKDPRVKNIRLIPETILHERMQQEVATVHAAADIITDLNAYYGSKTATDNLDFAAAVDINALGDVMGYEQALEDFTNLSDIHASFEGHINFEFSEVQPHPGVIDAAVVAPLVSEFSIIQAAYSTSANNAMLRNAYSEYKKAIEYISAKEINKILKETNGDPIESMECIRELARRNLRWQMFKNTFYAGMATTTILSSVIALVIGPAALFALIPFGIGSIVTCVAARYNRNKLDAKVAKFMNYEQIDDLIVARLNAHKHHQDSSSADISHPYLHKTSFIANLISFTARFVGIIWIPFVLISPIVTLFASGLHAFVTCYNADVHLRAKRRDPDRALKSARNPAVETVSMMSNRYTRNKFRAYLLNEIRLDKLEDMLRKNGTTIPAASPLEKYVYKFMNFLGLWESEKFDSLLISLDDPSSHALKEQLLHQCREFVFRQNLEEHLKKFGATLGLANTGLKELEAARKLNKPEKYNLLLRDYLNHTAIANAGSLINSVGLGTTLTVILIVVGIGMTFTPAGPFILAAVIPLLAIGYAITRIAAHYAKEKMRKAVEAVDNKELSEIFADPKTTVQMNSSNEMLFLGSATPTVKLAEPNSLRALLQSTFKVPKKDKHDLQINIDKLCDGISTIQLVTQHDAGALSVHKLTDTEPKTNASASNRILTVFAPKHISRREKTQDVHFDGSQLAWQVFLVGLVESRKKECTFTFGENLSPELYESRAKAFVQAMLAEFDSAHGINFKVKLNFADPATAIAVFYVLQNPEYISDNILYPKELLDKLRAHFGLQLIEPDLISKGPSRNGSLITFISSSPPEQNMQIFSTYPELVSPKEFNRLNYSQH